MPRSIKKTIRSMVALLARFGRGLFRCGFLGCRLLGRRFLGRRFLGRSGFPVRFRLGRCLCLAPCRLDHTARRFDPRRNQPERGFQRQFVLLAVFGRVAFTLPQFT